MKEYAVVFEKTSTGWSAYAPNLPGLGVAGPSYDATEKLIREGIEFHIEGLLRDGEPVPETHNPRRPNANLRMSDIPNEANNYDFELSDYRAETIAAKADEVRTWLKDEINQAKKEKFEIVQDNAPSDIDPYETLRIRWDGKNNKNNLLNQLSNAWLKNSPPDAKRALGIKFNELKQQIKDDIALAILVFDDLFDADDAALDITLPGAVRAPGIPHPLLKTMNEIVAVFHHLGYSTALGPQVESDFYNFEALNFPPNHPARDTQDTLLLAGQQSKPSRDCLLMRTHTSPVQIRSMIAQPPPIRIVVPGKVHRNDAADATHSPIFHQVEGLAVDTDITFSDLKGTLDHAMKELFGSSVKTRFFPSFFPFTEPSADVQISCIFCSGDGCRRCKHSGWIELLGCGMVDPTVFASVSKERHKLNYADDAYNPAKISGFAFGMGVERIAMVQHGISDIGQFYSGDMRFLEQFA